MGGCQGSTEKSLPALMPCSIGVRKATMADEKDKLDELIDIVTEFKEQYELDMRGENTVNGEIGLINEIRELKQYKTQYPSLTWLLSNKTIQTLAVIVGAWLFLWSLTVVGIIQILTAMLGISFP